MDDFDEMFNEEDALDCPLLEEAGREEGPQHNNNKSKRIIL